MWRPRLPRSGCCSASPELAQDLHWGGQMRLLIAGGGTGGDLFPALAVAPAFRAGEPDGAVLMVGRSGGPQEQLVPAPRLDPGAGGNRGPHRDAVWENVAPPR